MVSRSNIEEPVTQAQFGDLVDMSQQNVSALIGRGVLAPGGSLGDWLIAYCEHLRGMASDRESDSPLAVQRARLASEQADRVAMANAVMRKKLAPVSLLEEVLAHVCRQIVTQFDALVPQVRLRLPDVPGEAIRLIEDEVVRVRTLAANASLNDTDSTQIDQGDGPMPEEGSEDGEGASVGASYEYELGEGRASSTFPAMIVEDSLPPAYPAERCTPVRTSGQSRRRRKRLVGIDDEHHQSMQVRGPAARYLHRLIGAVTGFGLPGSDAHHAVGAADALLAAQHEERFRSRMAVDRRDAARGAAGLVDAQQVLRRGDARNRTHLDDLGRPRRIPARWAQ